MFNVETEIICSNCHKGIIGFGELAGLMEIRLIKFIAEEKTQVSIKEKMKATKDTLDSGKNFFDSIKPIIELLNFIAQSFSKTAVPTKGFINGHMAAYANTYEVSCPLCKEKGPWRPYENQAKK